MKMLKLLLTGIAIWSSLAGCSPLKPDQPPQVIQCPKTQVTPELLQPARHQAMDRLQDFLQTLPPSATPTEPNSTH